ncbi:MAG: hypothetical protein HY791_34710 [Deltaproteobacteria bacterium]|nr:hypothetical protein [Deltaproteobacteria bacterium]
MVRSAGLRTRFSIAGLAVIGCHCADSIDRIASPTEADRVILIQLDSSRNARSSRIVDPRESLRLDLEIGESLVVVPLYATDFVDERGDSISVEALTLLAIGPRSAPGCNRCPAHLQSRPAPWIEGASCALPRFLELEFWTMTDSGLERKAIDDRARQTVWEQQLQFPGACAVPITDLEGGDELRFEAIWPRGPLPQTSWIGMDGTVAVATFDSIGFFDGSDPRWYDIPIGRIMGTGSSTFGSVLLTMDAVGESKISLIDSAGRVQPLELESADWRPTSIVSSNDATRIYIVGEKEADPDAPVLYVCTIEGSRLLCQLATPPGFMYTDTPSYFSELDQNVLFAAEPLEDRTIAIGKVDSPDTWSWGTIPGEDFYIKASTAVGNRVFICLVNESGANAEQDHSEIWSMQVAPSDFGVGGEWVPPVRRIGQYADSCSSFGHPLGSSDRIWVFLRSGKFQEMDFDGRVTRSAESAELFGLDVPIGEFFQRGRWGIGISRGYGLSLIDLLKNQGELVFGPPEPRGWIGAIVTLGDHFFAFGSGSRVDRVSLDGSIERIEVPGLTGQVTAAAVEARGTVLVATFSSGASSISRVDLESRQIVETLELSKPHSDRLILSGTEIWPGASLWLSRSLEPIFFDSSGAHVVEIEWDDPSTPEVEGPITAEHCSPPEFFESIESSITQPSLMDVDAAHGIAWAAGCQQTVVRFTRSADGLVGQRVALVHPSSVSRQNLSAMRVFGPDHFVSATRGVGEYEASGLVFEVRPTSDGLEARVPPNLQAPVPSYELTAHQQAVALVGGPKDLRTVFERKIQTLDSTLAAFLLDATRASAAAQHQSGTLLVGADGGWLIIGRP